MHCMHIPDSLVARVPNMNQVIFLAAMVMLLSDRGSTQCVCVCVPQWILVLSLKGGWATLLGFQSVLKCSVDDYEENNVPQVSSSWASEANMKKAPHEWRDLTFWPQIIGRQCNLHYNVMQPRLQCNATYSGNTNVDDCLLMQSTSIQPNNKMRLETRQQCNSSWYCSSTILKSSAMQYLSGIRTMSANTLQVTHGNFQPPLHSLQCNLMGGQFWIKSNAIIFKAPCGKPFPPFCYFINLTNRILHEAESFFSVTLKWWLFQDGPVDCLHFVSVTHFIFVFVLEFYICS